MQEEVILLTRLKYFALCKQKQHNHIMTNVDYQSFIQKLSIHFTEYNTAALFHANVCVIPVYLVTTYMIYQVK